MNIENRNDVSDTNRSSERQGLQRPPQVGQSIMRRCSDDHGTWIGDKNKTHSIPLHCHSFPSPPLVIPPLMQKKKLFEKVINKLMLSSNK